MEDKEIWEGLGVEPEEEETPVTQEPEDTKAEDETDIPGEEDGEEEIPEEEGDAGDGEEPDGQDLKAVHQQELERVRQEGRDALNAQVKGMNLVDPYHDNRPITTVEELDEYKKAAWAEKVGRVCKAAGMTREEFDALVGDDPAVRSARETQERAEAAEQAAQQQQARERLDAEVAEIRKLCPEVKDLEALAAHKSYEKVIARMKQTGCGVLEAFKLENFDELMKQRSDGVRRQAARNQRGKNHLKGTTGKGKGGATIPADQLRIYQRLNPNASIEELQSFHAANNK